MAASPKPLPAGTGEAARRAIRTEFRRVVNMTPGELERWLMTRESHRVGFKAHPGAESVGHASGRRIAQLLQIPETELGDSDYRHMRKVIGYTRRHLAQRPTRAAIETSRWRYSLMNWGHDPLRKPARERD